MDLQGSLADTNLRIYPSKKLIAFLEDQAFAEIVPTNIGRLVIKDDYKPKNGVREPKPVSLSNSDIKLLNEIKSKSDENNHDQDGNQDQDKNQDQDENKENSEPNVDKDEKSKLNDALLVEGKNDNTKDERAYLTTSDIDWLYEYLKQRRKKDSDTPFLHELLEGSDINVPPNQVIKRNPDLEARCVKLRAQQEAREYRKMTKGVDNVRMRFPEDSISYQLKQMNRQMIAIGQFILSIFAGFLFGFRGVEWMVGNLDFGFRLLLGVMCALVIALAEIYFLAKKLNEELSIPETTQLGGPPKFADEKLYPNGAKNVNDKPHQD